MVTECNSCRARYRIKESLMQGCKAAEVRCRKCGGTFVVVTPGTVRGEPETADGRPGTGGLPGSRFPNAPDGPAGERELSPAGDGGERLQSAEAAVHPGTTPVEETDPAPPVPDNVFSLHRFREALPKRLHTGGYDISGAIRPAPSYSRSERNPVGNPPLPAPRGEMRRVQQSILEIPVQWRVRGTPNPSVGDSTVHPGESTVPEVSSSDKPRSRGGFTSSVYPRSTDIAFVYLLLLLLGGGGYLLIHFLSRLMSGGGG